MKKRIVQYIPAVEGYYGMRVWVPTDDNDLHAFVKLISAWSGYSDCRKAGEGYEVLYELPFSIEDSFIWKLAMERLNVEFVR